MSESGTDGVSRRPRYWTVVREDSLRTEVCTIDPDGLGEALVVFGFEEEAELFVGFEMGLGWQVRETTTGELVSTLYGPCAGVHRVVIDPLPRGVADRAEMRPLSVSSTHFTRTMVSTGGPLPALATLRP